jgi:hypothetical protein
VKPINNEVDTHSRKLKRLRLISVFHMFEKWYSGTKCKWHITLVFISNAPQTGAGLLVSYAFVDRFAAEEHQVIENN